ncbi:MAG: aminotransferase class I/II-fold pyridoxal phosphate-dependent enzyme [Cyanobacteria bacterium J06638_28]
MTEKVAATPAPLVLALAQAVQRQRTAFYAPGHKHGAGISAALVDLLGTQVFRADLPELPELDNLFAPTGPIHAAQVLAAQTFGAEETFFLANGSTCGIEAAFLAVCNPGDQVLIPRNAHLSVLSALVLCGARPIFLTPMHHGQWDLALGVTAQQIEQALQSYPAIRAVVVVSPNYQGICADIAAIATCVHAQDRILIVDEAHGAHLSFHAQLPRGAIAGGADLVIQSTHKVLAAMTQASMLHVQGQRIDRDRLRKALQLTQSTSPNYLLLASLDAARQQMAQSGQALMAQTLEIVQEVRSRLSNLALFPCLTPEQVALLPGNFQLDLTRLTVDVSALNITGFTADEWLHETLGVTAELPTLRQLAFIFSLGNSRADGKRLVQALAKLVQTATTLPNATFKDAPNVAWFGKLLAEPPLSPREAFFAPARAIAIDHAVGQISAATLCPYPPGIPVLLPGERITQSAVTYLQQVHKAGGVITGSADPTLQTLQIIDSTRKLNAELIPYH